ncbi:diguanylate cyclase [Klebsiella pneumoniae]
MTAKRLNNCFPASIKRCMRQKMILAEGIRQAVSEYQTLSVTVSIGVAEHHDGETVEQLFSRVDKALYAAKNDGRNRVTRMPFDCSERRRSRDGAA